MFIFKCRLYSIIKVLYGAILLYVHALITHWTFKNLAPKQSTYDLKIGQECLIRSINCAGAKSGVWLCMHIYKAPSISVYP